MRLLTLLLLAAASADRLYHQEPAASEPWSVELLEDYVTLGYDPAHGFVRGYQRSTGRVFAQGKAGRQGRLERLSAVPIQTERALIIALANSSDLSLRGACRVLRAGSGADSSDVGWVRPEGRPSERWAVRAEGRMGRQRAFLGASSGSTCACAFEDAPGLWKHLLGTFRSSGCSAPAEASRAHRRFCRELSVALSRRTFLLVSNPRAEAASSLRACWLQGLRAESEHKLAPSEVTNLATFRPPRAAVAVSMKNGAEAMHSVTQTLLSISRFSADLGVRSLRELSKLKQPINRLYGRKTHPRIARLLRAVNRTDLTDRLRACPDACTGAADPELAQFMATPGVSLTPEAANTTELSRSYAQYMSDMMSCNLCATRTLASFVGCLLGPYGIPAAVSPFEAHKLQRGLQQARTNRPGAQAIEQADEQVEAINKMTLALHGYVEGIANGHTHAMHLLNASARLQRDDVAQRIWCCASQAPFHLLNAGLSCKTRF